MGTTKKLIVATGTKFTLKRIETRELNKRDIDRNLRNLITYRLAAREEGPPDEASNTATGRKTVLR